MKLGWSVDDSRSLGPDGLKAINDWLAVHVGADTYTAGFRLIKRGDCKAIEVVAVEIDVIACDNKGKAVVPPGWDDLVVAQAVVALYEPFPLPICEYEDEIVISGAQPGMMEMADA
jgi:hypothetical protein